MDFSSFSLFRLWGTSRVQCTREEREGLESKFRSSYTLDFLGLFKPSQRQIILSTFFGLVTKFNPQLHLNQLCIWGASPPRSHFSLREEVVQGEILFICYFDISKTFGKSYICGDLQEAMPSRMSNISCKEQFCNEISLVVDKEETTFTLFNPLTLEFNSSPLELYNLFKLCSV